MPSSISQGLLLLAGLCCLVSGTQAKRAQKLDAFHYNLEQQEYTGCQNFSDNITDIFFALYRNITHWSETNILFSPVGIAAAIAMVSLGAKGDTHTQMLEGLGFNLREISKAKIHKCFQHLLHTYQQPDHQLQLTTGSSLFINESLRLDDTFIQDVQSFYSGTKAISINFRNTSRAMRKINKRVKKESHGEIVDLIKHLKKDTALALVNYIAFHGKWNNALYSEHPEEGDFHVDKQTTVKVPMTSHQGMFYLHWEKELSSWVLAQPYEGDAMAIFMLPDPGRMQQLEQRLTHKHFENVLRPNHIRSANVYFPKLSISGTYDLKSVLSTLGITKVFSNEADLSGVTKGAPLKLSKAVHKAVLSFDKDGVDMIVFSDLGYDLPPKAPVVKFNRPFLVFIKDENTNLPLFLGRVVIPLQV